MMTRLLAATVLVVVLVAAEDVDQVSGLDVPDLLTAVRGSTPMQGALGPMFGAALPAFLQQWGKDPPSAIHAHSVHSHAITSAFFTHANMHSLLASMTRAKGGLAKDGFNAGELNVQVLTWNCSACCFNLQTLKTATAPQFKTRLKVSLLGARCSSTSCIPFGRRLEP